MFQRYDDPKPLPIRRVAQPSALARQRMAMLRERENSSGHLSYALVLIFLFQTLLLGCVVLFLGALVLFSFIGVSFRAQETNQLAAAMTRMAPLVGTPAVVAILPPPTSTVAATVAPTPAVVATPTLEPTPPLAAPPLPTAPLPNSPLPTATRPVVSPLPAPPVNNAPVPPAEMAALQAYDTQIVPLIEQLSGAITSIRGLAQNPNFADQQWVTNVMAQIGIIRSAHNRLQSIQPPPLVSALHNELTNVVNICSAAADSFDATIASRNPANLNADVASIQNCLTNFPPASTRLREYLQRVTGK